MSSSISLQVYIHVKGNDYEQRAINFIKEALKEDSVQPSPEFYEKIYELLNQEKYRWSHLLHILAYAPTTPKYVEFLKKEVLVYQEIFLDRRDESWFTEEVRNLFRVEQAAEALGKHTNAEINALLRSAYFELKTDKDGHSRLQGFLRAITQHHSQENLEFLLQEIRTMGKRNNSKTIINSLVKNQWDPTT